MFSINNPALLHKIACVFHILISYHQNNFYLLHEQETLIIHNNIKEPIINMTGSL